MERTNSPTSVALVVLVTAAFWHTSVVAQVSLPMLSACTSVSPPALPTRWRAVGLMSPFAEGQLDIGEFVYDGTLPAMRATLYGLESGAVDLLITDTDTYLISGRYDLPTSCTSLGRKFSPPSTQWLSEQAICAGEAPIAAVPVQWWKTPAPHFLANWHLFKIGTRLPWRSMFVTPSPDPAIIGDYAMTYFPTFTQLSDTNLSSLHDFCVSQSKQSGADPTASAQTARGLMSIHNPAAESERQDRIAALIPGLSHEACSRMTSVLWPEQFIMTAIITPNRFEAPAPLPSVILYDWHDTATQKAIMVLPQQQPPVLRLLSYLKKGVGYEVRKAESNPIECRLMYPGIVRPDWTTAAQCQCKGVLDRNSVLSPNDVTQILACPIKQQSRVMWSWYTTKGRPVVFLEAGARGNGLMLADYDQWLPEEKAQATAFDLPKECTDLENKNDAENCSDCHTTHR